MDRKKDRRNGFTLVEGGLKPPSETRLYDGVFVMAEVTDTRLMGVIGIHVARSKGEDRIDQFFYLDAEEYGLDEYNSLVNCSSDDIEAFKRAHFGALGGSWNEISENDAAFLIADFILFSDIMGIELPEPSEEYLGYLDMNASLTTAGLESLWSKMCVPIRDDIELINYFLMRCAGLDTTGAAHLSSSGVDRRFLGLAEPATLFRNSVRKSEKEGRYICEALIDDGEFHNVICGIDVYGGMVIGAEKLSQLDITPWEASLILRRDEYIVYNRFDGNRELFGRVMSLTFDTLTVQDYGIGTLYMIFNRNNDHVRDSVYRLDRDTMAAVLLLNNGELVVAGDDPGKTGFVENMIVLAMSAAGLPVSLISSYKFAEQVVGAFLDSDYDRFQDFLEFIQRFEEK